MVTYFHKDTDSTAIYKINYLGLLKKRQLHEMHIYICSVKD